ncbi:MAG: Ig-like domain-containing protein, partial [Bryobacteraceae bacterium]
MKLIFAAAFLVPLLNAASAPVSIRIEPKDRVLHGEGASQQLLVIGSYSDGTERDLTGEAGLKVSDRDLASLDATGRLSARKNGTLTITATAAGRTSRTSLRVEDVEAVREFQFGREIGSIFTRQGCNGSGCHGGVKGRGGFKLSPGVLNPKDDYEWIVKGGGYQVLTA